MIIRNNEAAPNAFSEAATWVSFNAGVITLQVFNNPLTIRAFKQAPRTPSQLIDSPDFEFGIAPGSITIANAVGLKVKNTNSGSIARFYLQISDRGDKAPGPDDLGNPDPIITGFTPNTVILAASGGVSTLVPGKVLDYQQIIVSPGLIAPTTEATAVSLITGASVTYDGATPILIESYFPFAETEENFGAATGLTFVLWDNTANVSLGRIGKIFLNYSATANVFEGVPVRVAARLTPVAGARIYSIRAFADVANRARLTCGAGGVGVLMPAWQMITVSST